MASRNVGSKRQDTDDQEVPAELPKREAQDRSDRGHAQSPVDSMHVDAPTQQDNERGHRQERAREPG
jgi:hypothetical protein